MYITTLAIVGMVILNTLSTQIMAQSGPSVNWYEICKNPIVDTAIAEPCSTLTTNWGYTLTPEGEHVLACLSGGALAVVAGQPELLALKYEVGCGTNQHSSSSASFSDSSWSSRGSDPVGSIISNLFGWHFFSFDF